MSTRNYIYKGKGEPKTSLRRLKEEEIQNIIDGALESLILTDDVVVVTQLKELSSVLRKDLRRIQIPSNVDLDRIRAYIRSRMLDCAVMTHDRVGTKSAAATTADLAQQVISEKRGGSGKESGLSQIAIFEELVGASNSRKMYLAWVYPRHPLNREELNLLKRDLIGVKLGDVLMGARTARYEVLPDWYKDIDKPGHLGYHYEIGLDTVRMNSRGVLPSQIVSAIIASYAAKVQNQISVIASPYSDARIDIFFLEELDNVRTTSSLGAQVYMKRDAIFVKGVSGIEWINESSVSLDGCLQESLMLEDGTWVTYYNLVPALTVAMGEKHFFSWLDKSELGELGYKRDDDEFAFYTSYDPRDYLAAHKLRNEHRETRLEIEYSGKTIGDFFLDKRFDATRVITNDHNANQEALGNGGARMAQGLEFFALVKNAVANLDVRHVDLILDVMCSTGVMTGISAKGMEQRGADPISRFTFRQPEKIIREEAVFGLVTSNDTLAASHLIGNQRVITGSTMWRSSPNPLAGVIGQSAPDEYIVSLRGNRIPAPTSATEQVIREAAAMKIQREPMVLQKPALGKSKISGRRMPKVVVRSIE
jgi:hypothetical protein